MRRFHVALLALSCLAPVATGCAASFDGEIDSKAIPSFGSAAFGAADTTRFFGGDTHVVIGILAPGDSCADGAEFLKLQRRMNESQGSERADRAEKLADLMNERLPDDSWYAFITIIAADDNDLDDANFDFSDQTDGVTMTMSLCQRDGEIKERDGEIDSDDDCYTAVNGDVDITRSDDERTISLISDRGTDFDDDTGRDEGEVNFNIALSECDDMTDEVERSFAP